MADAFQSNAFQNNAFQTTSGGGSSDYYWKTLKKKIEQKHMDAVNLGRRGGFRSGEARKHK